MKIILLFWKFIFSDIAFLLCRKETKELIDEDVNRHILKSNAKKKGRLYSLHWCLLAFVSFRSIYYYRLCSEKRILVKVFATLSKAFLNDYKSIEITGGVFGGGFTIAHNCCVLHLESAGKNLSIGPFVVIGKKRNKRPVIGNDVTINANATVFGGITIGDHAIIGAGALVNKDVPPYCVVAGNPARVIKTLDCPTERE